MQLGIVSVSIRFVSSRQSNNNQTTTAEVHVAPFPDTNWPLEEVNQPVLQVRLEIQCAGNLTGDTESEPWEICVGI